MEQWRGAFKNKLIEYKDLLTEKKIVYPIFGLKEKPTEAVILCGRETINAGGGRRYTRFIYVPAYETLKRLLLDNWELSHLYSSEEEGVKLIELLDRCLRMLEGEGDKKKLQEEILTFSRPIRGLFRLIKEPRQWSFLNNFVNIGQSLVNGQLQLSPTQKYLYLQRGHSFNEETPHHASIIVTQNPSGDLTNLGAGFFVRFPDKITDSSLLGKSFYFGIFGDDRSISPKQGQSTLKSQVWIVPGWEVKEGKVVEIPLSSRTYSVGREIEIVLPPLPSSLAEESVRNMLNFGKPPFSLFATLKDF